MLESSTLPAQVTLHRAGFQLLRDFILKIIFALQHHENNPHHQSNS